MNEDRWVGVIIGLLGYAVFGWLRILIAWLWAVCHGDPWLRRDNR